MDIEKEMREALAKLIKATKYDSCCVKLELHNYSTVKGIVLEFSAYIAQHSGKLYPHSWATYFPTPMEAVDALLSDTETP